MSTPTSVPKTTTSTDTAAATAVETIEQWLDRNISAVNRVINEIPRNEVQQNRGALVFVEDKEDKFVHGMMYPWATLESRFKVPKDEWKALQATVVAKQWCPLFVIGFDQFLFLPHTSFPETPPARPFVCVASDSKLALDSDILPGAAQHEATVKASATLSVWFNQHQDDILQLCKTMGATKPTTVSAILIIQCAKLNDAKDKPVLSAEWCTQAQYVAKDPVRHPKRWSDLQVIAAQEKEIPTLLTVGPVSIIVTLRPSLFPSTTV